MSSTRAIASHVVLDLLADLSRRRWPYVVAGVLVAAFVVLPALTGGSNEQAESPDTTEESPFVDPTENLGSTTTVAGGTTAAGGTTVPGATTTVLAEVDRDGDEPNPGAIFGDRPDLRDNDQERLVGLDQDPARLSGFSVWVATGSVEKRGPDSTTGPFLKITVRLLNRDDSRQDIADDQWTLLRPDGIAVPTAYATPTLVQGTDLPANGESFAELWFPAPTDGRYWLSFRPDASSARGVWGLDVTLPAA